MVPTIPALPKEPEMDASRVGDHEYVSTIAETALGPVEYAVVGNGTWWSSCTGARAASTRPP